jgi:hypothetical protein
MPKNSFRQLRKGAAAWFKNKTASLTVYETLSLAISFISALSLIFIYLQTRLMYTQNTQTNLSMQQTTVSMQASMYATIATQTLEMDKMFIEKPELRPYFYDGVDIKEDDKNYNLVMSIAEYQLDYFDSTRTELGYIPKDQDTQEDRETWRHYLGDSFANSPILCKRIKANSDWYMEDLVKIARENCK